MSQIIFPDKLLQRKLHPYFQWEKITSLKFCYNNAPDYSSWSLVFISKKDQLPLLVLSIIFHSSAKQLVELYTKSSYFYFLQSM